MQFDHIFDLQNTKVGNVQKWGWEVINRSREERSQREKKTDLLPGKKRTQEKGSGIFFVHLFGVT